MTVVTGQPTRSTIAQLGRPLIVLGLTVIYAVCFVAIKAGLPFMPPLRFAGLRALLGGLALLGLMVALHRPLLPPRRSWPWIVALGFSSTTLPPHLPLAQCFSALGGRARALPRCWGTPSP
jgi:drug/metabolite transporter (DMT)-like permease